MHSDTLIEERARRNFEGIALNQRMEYIGGTGSNRSNKRSVPSSLGGDSQQQYEEQ